MEFREITLRREPGWFARSCVALTLRLGLGLFLLLMGYSKYTDLKKSQAALAQNQNQNPPAENADGADPAAPAEKPKFNPKTYPGWMGERFKNNRLKESVLSPDKVEMFAITLPYAEMGLGAALALGVLTPLASLLSGLLLVALLFGQAVLALDDPDSAAKLPAMFTYLLFNAAVIWVSPVTSNYFSLDGLIFGWFWKPKSEGDFTAN